MPIAPLHGVRVLDLTNVLAGPFCLPSARAHGRRRDQGRGAAAAATLRASSAPTASSTGATWACRSSRRTRASARSRSTSRPQAARTIFRRLVRTADVVVENFRPGVMDRLGLGYDELLKENPRLVYCAISGFGQDGPLRDLPAYDQIIQGMSGMMSITGAPRDRAAARRLSGGRHDRRHHRGLRGGRRAGRPRPHARACSSTCRCWRRRWPRWAGRCPTT